MTPLFSLIRFLVLATALIGSLRAQQEIRFWNRQPGVGLWGRPPITITPEAGDADVTFTVNCPSEYWGIRRLAQLPDWVESMCIEAPGLNLPLEWKVDEPVAFTLPKAMVKEGSLVIRVTRFQAGHSIGLAGDERVSLQLVTEGGDSHIPELTARLTGVFWRNGYNGSPDIRLPETTPIEQVLAALFESQPDSRGRHVISHHSLEARRVQVGDVGGAGLYVAILVDTDLGRKIAFLRYEENQQWFGRFYEVEASK